MHLLRTFRRARAQRILCAAVLGASLAVGSARAQQPLSPTDRATLVLTTAKGAFNDQNYEAAAERFREYLKLGAGTRTEIAAARYGLAVCLIDGPTRDYKTAAEMLPSAVQAPAFKERAYALYYLAVAQRALAEQVPANGKRKAAEQGLAQAAANFALAADAFATEAPAAVDETKELPTEWEWVAKARCEQADALLRATQFKAAATAAETMLSDPKLKRSKYAPQATYAHGYASFAQKEYPAAVRSLSALAPFDGHGEIGIHARYLLARTHHLAGDRPEAVADYQALVGAWERQRREARARLAEGNVPPAEKAALEASLVAPDYVARALFYWGVVLSEFGTADEAMAKFMEAAASVPPDAPWAAEARLRAAQAGIGIKKFPAVIDAVSPLTEDPRHADQALRYLAKAQYGVGMTPVAKGRGATAQLMAQPDPTLIADGVRKAVETLRKADERAQAIAATDPAAAARRGVILIELGDMLQLDRQYAEAAKAYRDAAAVAPKEVDVVERSLERQAVSLQLAGQFADADRACQTFFDRFPKSELRAEVSLRHAENALLAAHATKAPATTDGAKKHYAEAVNRFTRVIERHAEAPQANLARMGLANVQYLQGQFAEAAKLLAKIPEGERGDDLVGAALLQADCELRAIPATADDALSGARAAAQLEQVTARLETFVTARANAGEAADAWLRIGYASQRLAMLLADPAEKRRTLAKARRAYNTVVQQFPDHPLYPVALLENAKVLVRFGGVAPAVMELSKFTAEPLDKTPIAPLAIIHLADAQRARRQPTEAIRILTDLGGGPRGAEFMNDPNRADWAVALQYGLGLAYKEAGRYAEAREAFAKLAADFPKRPEAAEAVWRIAQCDTDPALAEVENNRRALAAANRPAMQEEILATLVEAAKGLRAAAERMGRDAESIAAKGDESDLPVKMNHDAAWCWRSVGEVEVEVAKRAAQAEAVRKLAERLAAVEGVPPKPGSVRPPEISLSAIPVQPGERMAREKFKAVAESGGDSPLADEARLELAEMYAQRDETEAAIAVIGESLAKATNADLSERLRIRLGTLQLAKGDAKGAATTAAELLMSGGERGYSGYARVLAVEAAYRLKDFAAVVEQARPLLESPRGFGRQPGVADHSILRMADAQGRLGKWRDARDTLDAFFARFPSGTLTYEARFAQGWVNENLKDTERAVEAYSQVAARVGGELGAKANLQVGKLRLAQDRPADALAPLLTVAYAYDDPELCPAALSEAAKALVKLNKPADARRLLERVVKDYPNGPWAGEARKQIGEVK